MQRRRDRPTMRRRRAALAGFCILSCSVACARRSERLVLCQNAFTFMEWGWPLSPRPISSWKDVLMQLRQSIVRRPSHRLICGLFRYRESRAGDGPYKRPPLNRKFQCRPLSSGAFFSRRFASIAFTHVVRTKSIGCAHCSPWTDNAYASVVRVRRIRQFFTHLLYPFSWALPLPLGLLTTRKALRFGAKQ